MRCQKLTFVGCGRRGLLKYAAIALGAFGMNAVLSAQTLGASLPAQTWAEYQFASDHNAVFDSPQWDVGWRADVGDKINGALSIVGTTLYVESFDRKLYALDALTGKTLWLASLPNIAMNAPLVINGLVIAGTGSNAVLPTTPPLFAQPQGDYVAAFDAASGAPRWTFRTVGEDMPTGVLVNGHTPELIFSNGDGHVYALNAIDGTLIWKQKILGVATMSSLAAAANLVFGVSTYHMLGVWYRPQYSWSWALRPQSGQFVWTAPFGDSDCSPTFGAGALFVESNFPVDASGRKGEYSEVYSLEAKSGALRWRYRSGVGSISLSGSNEQSIAGLFANGRLYQSLPFTRELAAFDARDGRVVWKIATQDPVKMSAVLKDGWLYFGDTAGYFYVVRAADGMIRARIKFPDTFTPSPPVIVGNTLFVTNGRTVRAIPIAELQRGSAP